ncbi:M12 family metallo-peptidase [Pseudohongiella sp. SYSU M77423]|uniref:M12 family metallo-peptidase n=1 Tax=Pseudohongiella sp. SYSU M77423 TaxID=3042312 RepID=UPI0024813C4D|nr:M12 family metallo-peptidase [Pseudohongiella sp. SYSU M77423]MDH7945132.1 M12 family metallo-peptidase [Pseudohongiella sp. SYSU M77423]
MAISHPHSISGRTLSVPDQCKARFRRAVLCICGLSLLIAGLLLTPVAPALADTTPEDHSLTFPVADLELLREGSTLEFRLPTHEQSLAVLIEQDQHYINGDRVISGHDAGNNASLIITLNREVAFAEIQINDERWLFDGERDNDVVTGRFYQPDEARLAATHSDFVVPGRHDLAPVHRVAREPQANPKPMTNAGGSAGPTQANSTQQVEISQQFSRDVVFVGQSAELEVTLTLTNRSNRSLNGLEADVYFILEDAQLVRAPACQSIWTRASPSQHILNCRLPDALAPGASRSLSYVVRVDAKAQPMRLLSTVYVGQTRQDSWINVVNDVTGGGNGQSAFNAAVAGRVPEDPLGHVVVDVMALFTPDVVAQYGANAATRINQMISVANQIYQNSGVGITLRPVYHGQVNYPGREVDFHTQLEQLTNGSHSAFAEIPQLRQRYGADLVVLFRPMTSRGELCGLANLGGYRSYGDMTAFADREYAFSLVGIDCPVSSVLVHEIGHNMGLTHSHRQDGEGGTFPYATGHAVDNQFATVMANPSLFGSARRVSLFSSPTLDCGGGQPCGVDHRDRQRGADAVRALNLVRYQIADYMPVTVPELPSRLVANLSGRETSARIALAATVDKGLNYTYRVTPSQRMDVTADFYIDPAHVGRAGQFHMVADLSSAGFGIVQLNQKGEIFDWDGSAADLVAYREAETLKPVEYLRVLQDFQPLPELVGHPLVIFMAYQLLDTGEVIYTEEPLVVHIDPVP